MVIEDIINSLNSAYPKSIHLLNPRWRVENLKHDEPAVGFCYIGAEAAYHLLGKKDIKVYYAVYYENNEKCTHWWLEKDGEIIDPTEKQYTSFGEKPPYHLGRRGGFLTKQPSQKAKELVQIAGLHF